MDDYHEIRSKPSSDKYRKVYDRIFRSKRRKTRKYKKYMDKEEALNKGESDGQKCRIGEVEEDCGKSEQTEKEKQVV